ncbi:hypothetical protein HZY97_16180 [Sphingomonas sp. R-74633]|uniref:hypothetical protein n=1 Tax=Sphingomonas sp. R-74633 TaxID=2751188 RepID=UPI0015D3212A|nr:hypothetical protein [Sphingomonas sp. R-74633]NYT42311.1 hypothetical protein [Sphingomonas sp. R-74633]
MTAAAPILPENRQTPQSGQSPEKGQSRLAERAKKLGALNRAGALMGCAKLAREMGQSDRTMRAYAACEIALPDAVLIGAAGALEREAQAMIDHAAKLRALAAQPRGDGK